VVIQYAYRMRLMIVLLLRVVGGGMVSEARYTTSNHSNVSY
jgi:hypothetical protein